MEDLIKEKYEAPTTKRTRVEMESGICVASDLKPGDDVSGDRHVSIDKQKDGGDFDFSNTQWE